MRSHLRSLRGRLIVLLVLLIAAAVAAGALMVGLFRQSATAQAGQAEAEIGRACDAIAEAYRFYGAGWQGPAPAIDDGPCVSDLTGSFRRRFAIASISKVGSGRAQRGRSPMPSRLTGSGPKTDVPQAELPRIQAVNRAALGEDGRPAAATSSSQILLVTACPLPGPIPSLTAWTMTRVLTLAGAETGC